jgi:glutamate-5-semialdehyde dehydrogenase
MSALEKNYIPSLMRTMGSAAKAAAAKLAVVTSDAKNMALTEAAKSLRVRHADIMEANALDMTAGEEKGLKGSFLDRLLLDQDRIEAMAQGLEAIAALADPIGSTLSQWERPNGLQIERVSTPLGVIGVIFESRPNVTADAGALCLKAGNAVILRGGSESFHSSSAIMVSLADGLKIAGLPEASIQLVPTRDRDAVGELLRLTDYVDVIVPRGGKSLIERITAESRIPMFKHLEGICHIYVDGAADEQMARKIIVNAKMRRTGICGAAETVLVQRCVSGAVLASIVGDLVDAGCEVRGDAEALAIDGRVIPATDDDWNTEYLDSIITLGIVDDVRAAVQHIARHGSQHTESIITEDADTAAIFLNEVDSAIVMVNASTQFADGGEFGMGAEIGISTGKLHARGPVGVEQLTSFKYVVRGTGQCRP